MRKFVKNYNEKYEEYVVPCLMKLLTTANRVRNIRIKPQSSSDYTIYVPEKLILSKINQDRYRFSQITEVRIILLVVLVI